MAKLWISFPSQLLNQQEQQDLVALENILNDIQINSDSYSNRFELSRLEDENGTIKTYQLSTINQEFKLIATNISAFLYLKYFENLQKFAQLSQINSGIYYNLHLGQLGWKVQNGSKNNFEIIFNYQWTNPLDELSLNHLHQIALLFQTVKNFNEQLINVNHQNQPYIKLLSVEIHLIGERIIFDDPYEGITYYKFDQNRVLKTTWKCAILKENKEYEIINNYPLLEHSPQLSEFINKWTYQTEDHNKSK